ncbi:MAG: carbohydrate ABC transporter permease [Clostridia bacterium]|nr:carbohydrate ABC transporter permease [Clostridia bacterium]
MMDKKISGALQTVAQEEYTPVKIPKNKKKIVLDVVWYIVGTILSLVFVLPIMYMLAVSTKSQLAADQASGISLFLPDFANLGTFFENYRKVFTDYGIWRNALNSLIYAAIAIVFNILVNGLAGYALSKFNFPGKKFFTFMVLFLIIVPIETSIVPMYTIVTQILKLNGKLAVVGVILPAVINIFNIFLFMQFFESIPKDYQEAARMDGAKDLRIFFKIVLPLSKPIVATVAVFCFIGVWNDYLWPMMLLTGNQELMPIQAVLQTIQNYDGITTGEIMASLVVTSLPIFIIYIVAQKYIVQGFGSAGLKL